MNEWLSSNILKKFDNVSWNEAIINLHNPKNKMKKNISIDLYLMKYYQLF